MSAMNEREITLIRDEDLLKKMWHETEDFGKKKEIRSHMYKLREARLKDLYNSNEVKDVQISTNTKSSFNQSTHADSLIDHSFASLKSKEIRDSESPTRDVSYRITGSASNGGWNVSKMDERSEDGKMRRILHSAQKSGSEIIPGGKLDLEAKCEQAVTSFQYGDDKNFIRSKGLSSNTVVRQEAVGGDGNSSFKTSSTQSSSSSKKVTEQKVSYDDSVDYISNQHKPSHQENIIQKSVKVYGTDAPKDLKNHPGYVEGHTKITRETKTLADGTVVTTTKYETTGANESKSTSSNQYSSSNSSIQEKKSNFTSSSSHGENYSSHKTFVDREKLPTDQPSSRSRYYVEKTHTIPDNSSDTYQNVQSNRTTNVNHQTRRNDESMNDSTSERNINERYGIVITADSTNDQSSRIHTDNVERTTTRQEQYKENSTKKNANISHRTEDVKNEKLNIENTHSSNTYQDVNSVPLGTPIEIEIDVSKIDINDNRRTIKDASRKQNKEDYTPKFVEKIGHDFPQKRESIKPTESEWKTESKPTKNQYDTTYRTDYTNKRISVELSPTHEAFARSLRAVSPDRLSSRSSSRNLKNSNSSLRSSSSPEKNFVNHGQPSRISPERQRCYSPTKKTPDRLSSTETITYNSRSSTERTFPNSSQKNKHISETHVTTTHSDVLNKKKKSLNDTTNVSNTNKFSRVSPMKSPSRSSTPSRSEHQKTTSDITTDLDDNVSTISNTTITKTEQIRPSSLKYSTTEIKESTKLSQFSPTTNISNRDKEPKNKDKKDKPIDRPLKRSDTYEERCRQILGITNETTERRRSSLEKLKRRGSTNSTNTERSSKDFSDQQHKITTVYRNSPPKSTPQTKEDSPKHETSNKQKSPLQEFPAQIRRSPDKSPKHPQVPTVSSNKKNPEPQFNQEIHSHSAVSPKEQPKVKDRKSPPKESNKILKHRSPEKEIRHETVQKFVSDSRQSSEDHEHNVRQLNKIPKDMGNKTVLGDENFTVSVNSEFIIVDSSESQRKNHQVSIDNKESQKTQEDIYGKTFTTKAQVDRDNQSPEKISPKSSTIRETSPVKEYRTSKEKTSVSDEVNTVFIKQEAIDQQVNSERLNTQENIYEDTSETKGKLTDNNYNQSPRKSSMPKSTTPRTSTKKESSPLREYPSQTREISDIDEVNSSFIKQETVNRQITEKKQTDKLTCKDFEAKVEINATKSKPIDNKPTKITSTPKSITSNIRETSPLKEYPSQIRKTSNIDEVNSKFIKQEKTNPQVSYEVPADRRPSETEKLSTEKSPNTFKTIISNETGEDENIKVNITEVSEKTVIPILNNDSIPKNNDVNTQIGQTYTTKTLKHNSDIISVTGSSDVSRDTYTTNTGTPKPKDDFKPNPSDTVYLKNKSSPKHINPTDRKSFPSQKNSSKEININVQKTTTDETEETLQHNKVLDSRKPFQPESNRPGEPHNSKYTDTSFNITVLETDVIYTNGDICEKSIDKDENIYAEPAFEKNSRDTDTGSQNEVLILITEKTTAKKNTSDKLEKHKHPYSKEKDASRNKEPKHNGLPLAKKTTNSNDISKPKNKPSQKIANYSSKTSNSSQNVRTELSTNIQNDYNKVKLKEQTKSSVNLKGKNREEIKEIHNKKDVKETYEGRTPVEEPLVIKKSVSLLYSDDEDDKKNTQMLIESEIVDRQPITEKKKDKHDKTHKITSSKFITNEKKEINSRSKRPLSKVSPKLVPEPEKKPLTEKNQSKLKINNETEYTDKYKRKTVQSKYESNKRQNSLSDIENFDDLKSDTSTHARFHRIDDNVNKTKSFTLKMESDERPNKISPKKVNSSKIPFNELPKSKISSRNKVMTEKTVQNVETKSNEPIQQNKPSTKLKHIVSSTILLKPKATTPTKKTVSSTRKNDMSKTSHSVTTTKVVMKPEESDDESIPDSLDENIHNSVKDIVNENHKCDTIIISKSKVNRNVISPERKTPSRNYSQPELVEEKPKVTKLKFEKRCISTKSIIINNTDRGITVDLQRSISSREPTPDRVCPHPVTSDDEGVTPRFPDKVVEPDDTSLRKNNHRLFETIIHENDDGKEFQRIVEITEDINQKVTEVDKVDRDDDSLLTVNKKINKFLTTADRLTEKPIMDISQPAPKVERQKFEVTEDLKEDDCLLSVSDKVNKFINEAEHLTSHNNSHSRKSVNLDIKTDISKKVNSFTLAQEGTPSKPSHKNYVSDNTSPERNISRRLLDDNQSTIQQDVFITTECDQIEKEEDLFRTTKHSSKVIYPKEEPEHATTPATYQSRPNFKPYNRKSESPEKGNTERSSPVRTTPVAKKELENFKKTEQEIRETPRNKKTPDDESFIKFTPKNRRPSQEDKVILSTVGRLRSNESIKKAKAIFENVKSSDKETRTSTDILMEEKNKNSKEITRKPIDRSNLTPKRLDFPSKDETSINETTRKNSDVKYQSSKIQKLDDVVVTSTTTNNTCLEHDIPGYMKPLHRPMKQHSPHREQLQTVDKDQTHERSSSIEKEIPGYMKPLDRSTRPHSPTEENFSESEIHRSHESRRSISREEIPGYMKPLDRTLRPNSPQRDSLHPSEIHEKPTSEESVEELPGYMKPLKPHTHHMEYHHSSENIQKENLLSHQTVPSHEPTSHHKKDHLHSSEIHHNRKSIESMSREELPGYMQPLTPHTHQREYLQTSQSHHTHDFRETDDTDEIPGYMKPIMSHSHESEPLHPAKTHDSDKHRELVDTDEVPGYMKPIMSHRHEREPLHPTKTHDDDKHREAIHKDEISRYSKPLMSHGHEREPLHSSKTHDRDRHGVSVDTDEVPGYMKPIMSHRHEREPLHPTKTHDDDKHREPIHKDEISRHSKPLMSHSHEREPLHPSKTHDSNKHTELNHKDEVPGYMKPLMSHRHEREPLHPWLTDEGERPREFMYTDEISGYTSHSHHSEQKELIHRYEPDNKIPQDRTQRAHSPHKGSPHISNHHENQECIQHSSEEELPGYMKPLDRSNRPHSPKRDAPSSRRTNEQVGTPTKFGVTLKRTDSSKGVTSTGLPIANPKKHPILSKKNITEEEIEEIFELEVLEELLLIITGYELRRQIRTQIRTVKRLIAEDKLEVTIRNIRNKNNEMNQSKQTTRSEVKYIENKDKPTTKTSPQRKSIDNRHVETRDIMDKKYNEKSSEYSSSYTRKESTSSFIRSESPGSRSSKSPERKSPERKSPERKSPERKSPERKLPERKSPSRLHTEDYTTHKNVDDSRQTTKKNNENKIRQEASTKTTNIFKSSLKKTEPKSKTPVKDVQPEWASQRNLKKVTNNHIVKKATVSSSSGQTVRKESVRSSSPAKEMKPTDVITSSYGVGPTDENGTPLFGLKALRAQNKSINTKVQGTVVSSQYYSETGKEPVGQISFTKYSSDPRDLGSNENLTYQDEGILSITTTQKFGFDDAPSLKQLTNTKREICDSQTDKKTSTSKSSTITRRNSVKALTQKFVENAVEATKNEQQSSYPKAGLILRSSSFKNDSTLDASDSYNEITAEERTQKSVSVTSSNPRVVSGGTFLRNKSKVTGIQDVVTRMKAEDVETGDTSEDIEARGLLNKYLGSQTILSGIEGQISKTTTSTARTSSCSASVKSTTKVTTVIMENGKEVKKTRIFEHPISNEVLETVWDEQTLRYLLDQSTDYEERKKIRARLRLIMAEQEACTELVKQASQDQSGQSVDETIEMNKEVVTEGPVTTTKVATSRVTKQEQMSKKPISPFAKFRQLDKQNSLNTPPSSPRTPGGSPLFKFTDAALSQSASTIKDRLLYWCRMKTKEYENIQLDNFSSSWADGLAFCALIHHFLPNSFDYHVLTPKERRHNFTLAFKVADEKADIAPLLDVDDMVATRRPDWKCVFTYVQSIYRRFKDED